MREIVVILSIFALIANGCSSREKFIIQTEDKYETIDGEQINVGQEIRTLRQSDSLPISVLTKIRVKGELQDFLREDLQYDNAGNNTIKKCFVFDNGKWVFVQEVYFKYRSDKQISSFHTKRVRQKEEERGRIYRYDNFARLIEDTEYECNNNVCDSTLKICYIYNTESLIHDSIVSYIWRDNEWSNKRTMGNNKRIEINASR